MDNRLWSVLQCRLFGPVNQRINALALILFGIWLGGMITLSLRAFGG